MPQRVIVARDSNGKVTTIDIRLGEKGVPFGWEYVFCDTEEIPKGSLNKYWGTLSKGKKIFTSVNEETSRHAIAMNWRTARAHLLNIERRRKERLQELDVEFLRTFEDGDKRKRRAIINLKNKLRALKPTLNDFSSNLEVLDFDPEILKQTTEELITKNKYTWYIGLVLLFILFSLTTPIISIFI